MRYQGRVSDWNDAKGFGFVISNGSGDNAFVHIKAFASASCRPVDGELITYTLNRDTRGRWQANAIRFAGELKPVDNRTTPGWLGPAFTLIFAAALVGAALIGQLTMTFVAACSVMSVIAFTAYGLDKSAAAAGRQRTPEATLHFLGLLSGWPGALLTQRVFRHKSRKREFQATYWGTVAINVGMLALLGSDTGSGMVRAMVSGF